MQTENIHKLRKAQYLIFNGIVLLPALKTFSDTIKLEPSDLETVLLNFQEDVTSIPV